MARTKSHPKRKARTVTIVGAAAHAALATVFPDDEVAAIAGAAATDRKDDKRKRRLMKKNTRHGDEDSDEDVFEAIFKREDSVIKSKKKRVKFACDEVAPKARRRLIFDDDEGVVDESMSKESDGMQETGTDVIITIQPTEKWSTISIPSSAYQKSKSLSAFELIRFQLPNTNMVIIDTNGSNPGHTLGAIVLTNNVDAEFLLRYCNQDNNSIDVISVLRAFENEILEIGLMSTTHSEISVSINLLLISSLHDNKLVQSLNAAPPIPVPRKNKSQKLSKPHPSYSIIQALSGVFKGSIFDDVAKSCFVPDSNDAKQQQAKRQQKQIDNKSVITARIVYSVVDNVHANEYEQPSSRSGPSPSNNSTTPLVIPGLVPTLRPYQEAAVRWMIQRESDHQAAVSNDEWELCWYVIVQNAAADCQASTTVTRCNIIPLSEWKSGKSSPNERQLLCNPFAGWVAATYEDAKFLMFRVRGEVYHPKGGMLCESMGLGKTVEVIACMLANPSPLTSILNSNDDPSQPKLSPADEAVRIFQSKTVIKSRATLIVTPPSILTQWEREIARHTKKLKVIVYPGMKDLCGSSSSSNHLLNPRVLADADVVLTTFNILNSDIGHSDENPYTGTSGRLRHGKRHIVLPSPLSSVEWYRVLLDEAQRVEAPTTASARMARKLRTGIRWCVSGTPIGRHNFKDLYGLFLFLSFRPFDEKNWFTNSFVLSHGDATRRLSHLLRNVMWRSTKQNSSVREQMGIPEQEEKKVILRFSSIEKYFYNKQYDEALGAVKRWSAAGRPDKLHLALNKLRAACCHPQVGASGISGSGNRQHGSSYVLSMEEILNKLIDDSKVRCEEAQRLFVLHTNGMACLSKLRAETCNSSKEKQNHLEKSFRTYLEVIDMMNGSSSPTVLLGSAVLGGSLGFRMSGKKVSGGAILLDWQMKLTDEKINIAGEAWSDINFTSSKRVICVKIRPSKTLPAELGDTAGSWTILQPKECVFQTSSALDGGGFVDIGSVMLKNDGVEEDGWNEISGFRANKSKACRLVIKSYHELPSRLQTRNCYFGLEAQFFEPRVSDDPLQRLHTLHNASMVLSMLHEDNNVEANNSYDTARLERMEREGRSIHDNYMAHAQAIHHHRKRQLSISTLAREKCAEELNALSNASDGDWYEDALGWHSLYGSEKQQRQMCEAVAVELRSYYDNMNSRSGVSELDQILIRGGRFPAFSNIDGLHAALKLRIKQGRDEVGDPDKADRNSCLQALMNLSAVPSTGEVWENSRCHRCRSDWHQQGPVCRHCRLEDDLAKFERLSNDPEINCVLKAMTKVLKSHLSESNGQYKSYLRSLNGRAVRHLELRRLVRDEIKAAKAFWRAHFDLLSDIDELNQCKSSMRLRREGEDISTLTQNEAAFIVDRQDIAAEYFEHEAKQALALAEMRRSEDSMRFLINQSQISQSGRERNICTICLASIQDERSVLSCGHSFHPHCVDQLFRVGGGAIRCPMRCPIPTTKADLLLASNKSKEDGSRACREIKGDYGTKVNRLIGDVIDTVQLGDKGLILSQWEDMLDIVAEGLAENNIKFIRPKGGKQFGQDVKLFRSSDCPILLLNVKNGAEGLTLTEANHAFVLEPILNHAIDAQAINRIHRIGQTSKTYVHRYIVADTVEEKIDAMRVEREANHFEDDIIQERKDHFDQNEIDQIFS
ncbi:hypothetical protein ACHAXM_009134 [Skeletonema potamos]|jgi:SNF2 family DNA or RNA helicase